MAANPNGLTYWLRKGTVLLPGVKGKVVATNGFVYWSRAGVVAFPVITPSGNTVGTASFLGGGTFLATGKATDDGTAVFSGGGTFVATGKTISVGRGSFVGGGTFAASGKTVGVGAGSFSGGGTFTAVGKAPIVPLAGGAPVSLAPWKRPKKKKKKKVEEPVLAIVDVPHMQSIELRALLDDEEALLLLL